MEQQENQQQVQARRLFPLGTRVTHFDGHLDHTHGVGTIVAYNGIPVNEYLKEKPGEAIRLANEAGETAMLGLAASFYDGQRCPYVVHWDVHPQRTQKYPKGYKDVYEPESVRLVEPVENIFYQNGVALKEGTILYRRWRADENKWSDWEEISPEDAEKVSRFLTDMELCVQMSSDLEGFIASGRAV